MWLMVAIISLINFPVDFLTGPYPFAPYFLLVPLCVGAWYRKEHFIVFSTAIIVTLILSVARVAGMYVLQQDFVPTELSFVRALMRIAVVFVFVFSIDQIAKRLRASKHYTWLITQALEDERRKMALLLHDDVGQMLAIVSLNLNLLRKSLDESKSEVLDECNAIIKQVLQRIRNASSGLRPPMLDDFGILSATRALIEEFSGKTSTRLHLNEDIGMGRFESPIETACYRIIQESLTNAINHSEAENIWISLHFEMGQLSYEIRDDGVGFHVESSMRENRLENGLGLTSMKEQAKLFDGKLSIQSSPGTGVSIVACLPAKIIQV